MLRPSNIPWEYWSLILIPWPMTAGLIFYFAVEKKIKCRELGVYIYPAEGVFLSDPSEAAQSLLFYYYFFKFDGRGKERGFLILLFR